MDFYGPAVNRAARIEGLAEGGQFIVCESTKKHTLDDPACRCDRRPCLRMVQTARPRYCAQSLK